MIKLMKESATKQKLETVYVNRLTICVATFLCSILLFLQLHNVAVDYVYNEPTSDYNIMGAMSGTDSKKAMEITEQHNKILVKFKGKPKTTKAQIEKEVRKLEYFKDYKDAEIEKQVNKIYDKLQIINAEYLKWFELLLAFVFAGIGYMGPKLMLIFQKILRQLEIENEIMQFQTIILMLMKIERVNVEIILEWLERYANIFKEPITKCVNNYEAGAWEALEELKEEVAAPQFIRIVESLQAAVEKIPIAQAFDELDNEREYYQEKRKETNDKLISRKGLIGKVVGFAPMVLLFVGYLIIPLVAIGLLSMTDAFSTMSSTI